MASHVEAAAGPGSAPRPRPAARHSIPLGIGAPDSAGHPAGRAGQPNPGDLPEPHHPEVRSTVRSREDALSAAAADLQTRGFDAHVEGTDLVVRAGRTVCRVRNLFRPAADARREAEDLLVALVARALVDTAPDATDGAGTESGPSESQT